uniref:Cilia- and flagella-associated protein 77 n=1 Tax=Phasianus colchicus TaxID=9054 RepID=A0A669Q6K2_PHACC
MAGSPYNSVVNLCHIQHPAGSSPEGTSQLLDPLCAWVWAVDLSSVESSQSHCRAYGHVLYMILFSEGVAHQARSLFFFDLILPQAELGKPLRNCYTLPGLDFSYGLYIERTDGGVPEAIGHWNTIKPRTNLTQKMPRDFITMNRGALKAGYTTAREFNLYYKAKDIRCKDDEYSRFRRSPPHVPADRTYGIPVR